MNIFTKKNNSKTKVLEKEANKDSETLARLSAELEKLWDEVFSLDANSFPPVDYTVNNVNKVSNVSMSESEYFNNVRKLSSLPIIGNSRDVKKDSTYKDLELFLSRCFSVCNYNFSDFSIAHQLEILYLYNFPFLFSTSGENKEGLNEKEKELESVLAEERNKYLNYRMFLKLVSECPNSDDFISMVKMLNRKDRISLDFATHANNCERDLDYFNDKVNMQDVAFGMCDFDLFVNMCLVNNNYSQKATRIGNEVVVNVQFIESLVKSL